MRLDFDPFRLSGIGEGSSKYAGRRVPIPTCMLSRRTSDGRDVSTYTEEAPTQGDLNHLMREDPMWQDAVAIMPGETAADLALYHSHHKELMDLAESTSSAEDFKQRAGAWLYQRRTLDDFAEPAKKSSERARAVADVNAAGDDGGVNGDSSVDSDLQEKERRFRESIVQDYPGEPC